MNETSSSPPGIEMTNQFKREIVLAEMKQWSPPEQCIFLADAMNMISFSLVKFMSTFCSDLSSRTDVNTDGSFDLNSKFSGVMEDQANDIGMFS